MFDATQYVSQNTKSKTVDRSPIPEGNYLAKLTGFERRAAKSGNGEMLNAEFTVTVGSTARKCWHNFNFTHTKEDTVEYAFQQFANLCVAAGYNSIQDPWNPVELIDKGVEVYIVVEGQYNNIKAFKVRETTQMEAEKKLYSNQPAVTPGATPPQPVDDEIPF